MARVSCSFCFEECGINKIEIVKDVSGKQYICYNCYRLTGIKDFIRISQMTQDEIRPYISEAHRGRNRINDYKPTDFANGCIESDFKNKLWVASKSHLLSDVYLHKFRDIISYSVIENGVETKREYIANKQLEKTLFLGDYLPKKRSLFDKNNSCYELKVVIYSSSIVEETVEISLIDKRAKFNSKLYESATNSAMDCIKLIERMMNDENKDEYIDFDESDDN